MIDCRGLTVMPGLIDAHCHITFGEPASNDELFFHRPPTTSALLAAFNVRKLLLADRDVGHLRRQLRPRRRHRVWCARRDVGSGL